MGEFAVDGRRSIVVVAKYEEGVRAGGIAILVLVVSPGVVAKGREGRKL